MHSLASQRIVANIIAVLLSMVASHAFSRCIASSQGPNVGTHAAGMHGQLTSFLRSAAHPARETALTALLVQV